MVIFEFWNVKVYSVQNWNLIRLKFRLYFLPRKSFSRPTLLGWECIWGWGRFPSTGILCYVVFDGLTTFQIFLLYYLFINFGPKDFQNLFQAKQIIPKNESNQVITLNNHILPPQINQLLRPSISFTCQIIKFTAAILPNWQN